MHPTTLLLGIGNTLRSDDGVAAYICARLQEQALPGVTIQTTQQLQTEFLEEFLKYDRVVVVDASVTAGAVELQRVEAGGAAVASSHHMSLSLMAAMAQQLFGKQLQLYACAVPVLHFRMGETLSTVAQEQATKAIALLRNWLQQS